MSGTDQQQEKEDKKKKTSMNKGLLSVIAGNTVEGGEGQDNDISKPFVVACIGGGQLGRMMALEAPRLGIQMKFLDPLGMNCPAAHVVPSHCIIKGGLNDANKIRELARGAQVVTVEIEHVNVEALAQLEAEKDSNVNVQPSARVLRIIQDKFLQKQHFLAHNIAVPPFLSTPSIQSIMDATAPDQLGLPLMLKTRRGGYDGRGNAVLKSNNKEAVLAALQQLGVVENDDEEISTRNDLDIYAEGWIAFDVEVAVIVVRSSAQQQQQQAADHHHHHATTTTTVSYPAVNAIQQDSICRVVLAPARNVSEELRNQCQDLAIRAIDSLAPFGASGTFGVEMFIVTKQGDDDKKQQQQVVLLNEVAPRPHNTGHYTQDACAVSQFENHLRGICGLPLGNTQMQVEAAAMVNILGQSNSSNSSSSMQDTLASSNLAMTSLPNAVVHWYGKKSCRRGRKMGHINITGHSHGEIDAALAQLMQAENIPASLLPNNNTNNKSSSRRSNSSSTSACPVVGVIMGSQSDLPTMKEAVDVLQRFNIPHQVDIVSAHRTPDKLMEYSRAAAGRGIRVIIAGAGGAAHLPGMVAAMTPLPVIGVPVKTSTLNGVDSLYSIVQMPKGVPVATVAIGNAMNAGLLAVRILATSRPQLRLEMIKYQNEMKDMVNETSTRLLELGSDEFLEQMDNKNKSVNV